MNKECTEMIYLSHALAMYNSICVPFARKRERDRKTLESNSKSVYRGGVYVEYV